MTEANLKDVSELYMPRKSFDVFKNMDDIIDSTQITTRRLLENSGNRYKKGAERWEEMDQYWAQENAAFLVRSQPYHQYLSGRYYTYDALAGIIMDSIKNIKNAETVEIGSGSGICLVIQAIKGMKKVHGFDKSYGAICFFEDLAQHYKIKDKIESKQGDFYATGYEDNRFDATFNMGVFEHLSKNDQKRLMTEMARITKPNGVILVGIPNSESFLYRFSRDKERNFFGKLIQYVFPLVKHEYSVNLRNLFEEAGIKVKNESAVLIAPPSEIPSNYLTDEIYSFYEKIPKMGKPEDVKELMRFWRVMEEKVATPEELMKIGWYKYVIGRKPSRQSNKQTNKK